MGEQLESYGRSGPDTYPSYFCSLGVISATFALNLLNICFLNIDDVFST